MCTIRYCGASATRITVVVSPVEPRLCLRTTRFRIHLLSMTTFGHNSICVDLGPETAAKSVQKLSKSLDWLHRTESFHCFTAIFIQLPDIQPRLGLCTTSRLAPDVASLSPLRFSGWDVPKVSGKALFVQGYPFLSMQIRAGAPGDRGSHGLAHSRVRLGRASPHTWPGSGALHVGVVCRVDPVQNQ